MLYVAISPYKSKEKKPFAKQGYYYPYVKHGKSTIRRGRCYYKNYISVAKARHSWYWVNHLTFNIYGKTDSPNWWPYLRTYFYHWFNQNSIYITSEPLTLLNLMKKKQYLTQSTASGWPGPVFCPLLGVSSDYAQPITGQVTEVTCPVIGQAQPELTLNKIQKTGPGLSLPRKTSNRSSGFLLSETKNRS